ncbi:DUF6338 family protein [Streptomyces sp. NPDC101776]|uniref:DUF6338 family protein n=1 Tax=Streptomyces sp. NPDC101776 TaxID=3366146 RepID=UPI00382DD66F
MPTTVTGLLLLVVLLLPGLAYAVVRERQGTERGVSSFRETGAVVFASIISEIVVLGFFAMVRSLWPRATPDIGRLIREGSTYARAHYASLALWSVALLLLATALAGLAACAPALAARVRRPRWLAAWIAGRAPGWRHPSTTSAWWVMFERWYPGENAHVGCVLEDGSYVEGRQASFNINADDSPDRDLILIEPLRYRPPGAAAAAPYPAGAVCISARRIVAMFVSYPPAGAGPGAAAGQGPGSAAT